MKRLLPPDLQGIDAKKRIVHQGPHLDGIMAFVFVFNKGGFKILEVNAGQRLLDMQLARLAIEPDSVPIKDPIGRVGILLDFKDEQPGANGVKASARQKNGVAGFDGNTMNTLGDRSSPDASFKYRASDTRLQPDKQFGTRRRIRDVPHLCLRFTAKLLCDRCGWMNLQREDLARIQDFDQQRETCRGCKF